MTSDGRKDSKMTPEELARLHREAKEEYEKCKKVMNEKPSWMIDENSTLGRGSNSMP
jgi:hypothetical protein